jgi:hypothetical protein
MTRFAIALLGACALALTQAPGALALIQLDKGISGVRIGNTKAQVRASLGTPQKSRSGQNEFGRFVQYSYAGAITVVFQGEDRVSSIVTTGLGDRTASGIGVGSPEDAVKNISGIRCETFGSSRSCHTGRLVSGRKVTDFRISNGKVTSVFVGQVLD